METYISILRGINVSGQKLIKMDELKNIYQKLGYQNVQTYIQSGNVIFQSEETNIIEIENKILNQIKKIFGFDVPIFILKAKQMQRVFNNNPFLKDRSEDISRLYVSFLSASPEVTTIEMLNEGDYGTDEFIISGNIIYLFCPINGYGKTKLSNTYFENKLKVTASTRNWKTIIELVKLSS